MKIGPFLAEIEAKTLKKTHYGVWVVGEGRLFVVLSLSSNEKLGSLSYCISLDSNKSSYWCMYNLHREHIAEF